MSRRFSSSLLSRPNDAKKSLVDEKKSPKEEVEASRDVVEYEMSQQVMLLKESLHRAETGWKESLLCGQQLQKSLTEKEKELFSSQQEIDRLREELRDVKRKTDISTSVSPPTFPSSSSSSSYFSPSRGRVNSSEDSEKALLDSEVKLYKRELSKMKQREEESKRMLAQLGTEVSTLLSRISFSTYQIFECTPLAHNYILRHSFDNNWTNKYHSMRNLQEVSASANARKLSIEGLENAIKEMSRLSDWTDSVADKLKRHAELDIKRRNDALVSRPPSPPPTPPKTPNEYLSRYSPQKQSTGEEKDYTSEEKLNHFEDKSKRTVKIPKSSRHFDVDYSGGKPSTENDNNNSSNAGLDQPIRDDYSSIQSESHAVSDYKRNAQPDQFSACESSVGVHSGSVFTLGSEMQREEATRSVGELSEMIDAQPRDPRVALIQEGLSAFTKVDHEQTERVPKDKLMYSILESSFLRQTFKLPSSFTTKSSENSALSSLRDSIRCKDSVYITWQEFMSFLIHYNFNSNASRDDAVSRHPDNQNKQDGHQKPHAAVAKKKRKAKKAVYDINGRLVSASQSSKTAEHKHHDGVHLRQSFDRTYAVGSTVSTGKMGERHMQLHMIPC